MKITLSQAFDLLSASSAVIVDGVVTYANLDEIRNDPDNEFLYIGWTDDDGADFCVKAIEGNNQEAIVGRGVLTLVDSEGESFEVTLLEVMDSEKYLNNLSSPRI